jgi:hypothetical protein
MILRILNIITKLVIIMLKRTFKFRLFLMASLIMVLATAAATIVPTNHFSKAMAIEMDSQGKENTQLFANDPVSKTNSMSDSTPFSVIDVLSPQQAQTSKQDSTVPPGLSKLNQITPENLYTAIGPGETGSNFASSIASCDPGDIAISGGMQAANFETAIARIGDVPQTVFDPSNNFTSWRGFVTGEDNDIDRLVVAAYAQCFDNPPLRP